MAQYDGSLKFDTVLDPSGFSKGTSKLGSIAQTALGVLGGNLMTQAINKVGELGKAAITSVGSLEQNLGGVETLFKENAQTVIDNANKAYSTAGMSANEYMQNVTSFSASLLQSVAGDTAEAARVADMAMVDMSDNANKMGTDMERITDAYQGFAKQNYTMLDNLKLGYGGTKTEMQRLLADAQKITGIEYNIENLNDVYEAIHVIQGELGITGTTALEASTTIEGSMSAAKAAFDNFLNGSGSVEELTATITTAAVNIGSALMEIIPRLVETIPAVISGLGTAIVENSDQLLAAGQQLLTGIQAGITEALPQLASTGLSIINGISQGITGSLTSLNSSGQNSVSEFVNGLMQKLPDIISSGGQILTSLIDKFLSGLPQLWDSGVKLIGQVAQGILSNLPEVLASMATVIAKLIVTIASHMPELLQKGIEMLGKIAAGIISAIPQIVSAAGQAIQTFWNEIKNTDWISLGGDIISGVINGLKAGLGRIASAAKEVANEALNAAKNFLGIHSPSKVFKEEVGKNIALGIGDGIRQNKDYAKKSAEEISKSILDAAKTNLANYKVYNNLLLSEEVAYWDAIRKQVNDGTQARIDADKEYFNAKKDLNNKSVKAEEEYTDKVASAYEDLNNKISDLNKEYRDAVENRTDEIKNAYGLFDEFKSNTDLTSDDLLSNLEGQVEGLRQWRGNLDTLAQRGVGDDLISELQNLGPQSAAEIKLLAEMTDDELDRYVSLFRSKNRLARRQAVEELKPMQADISRQISDLKSQTQKELTQYQEEYISAMEELGVVINKPAEDLKLLMAQNAVEMVATLASSIKEELESTDNTEKFRAIADNILNATNTLPSDMLIAGQAAIESMISGINSRASALASTMQTVVTYAVSKAINSALAETAIKETRNGTTIISGSLQAKTYGNEGYGPGTQIDYDRIGEKMAEALNGVDVSMDGQKVGNIVSEPVNSSLGSRSRMEERDMV